jgi:hypothetical protein
VKSRRPLLSDAYRRVAMLLDEQTAHDLCCRNPAHVAAGEAVPAGRRATLRRRWKSIFSWRRAA